MTIRKASKKNIALIGARGVGKSKLSRRLKRLCGWPIMSTDSLLSYEMSGLAIAEIVEKIGWDGFRDLEHQVLKKITKMEGVILDCGGGILVNAFWEKKIQTKKVFMERYSEEKGELLKNNCHIVYLKCSKSRLLSKNEPTSARPPLPEDYETLLDKRFPFYEKTADFILDVEGQSSSEAAFILYEKYFRNER